MRECGTCTLCCRLLPIKALGKPANTRCEHQRHSTGCKIYSTRPTECRLWSCRWLVENDTADLRRPDRSRYVIDLMPDFIILQLPGEPDRQIEVVQIWVDPNDRDAWRDPPLLDYLKRRAQEGIAGLIRYGSKEGITVFAPAMAADGQWHVQQGNSLDREHSPAEKRDAVQAARAARSPEWQT